MSKVFIDARISNFIQRKMATMGATVTGTSAGTKSGINYEALALPKTGKDAK